VLTGAGHPPLAFDKIRPHVSRGAAGLVELAFGPRLPAEQYAAYREALLEHYRNGLAEESRLFPGMAELLDGLESFSLLWGVVTNKPGWLTVPLLEALGLVQRAACIVAGDTLAVRKPDPAPLEHACRVAGVAPSRAVYVGDDERDVAAGARAGMATYAALFGYLGDDTPPREWGATALLEAPSDLLRHVTSPRATPS
jgi:phosphoglycolate phosphatase